MTHADALNDTNRGAIHHDFRAIRQIDHVGELDDDVVPVAVAIFLAAEDHSR